MQEYRIVLYKDGYATLYGNWLPVTDLGEIINVILPVFDAQGFVADVEYRG